MTKNEREQELTGEWEHCKSSLLVDSVSVPFPTCSNLVLKDQYSWHLYSHSTTSRVAQCGHPYPRCDNLMTLWLFFFFFCPALIPRTCLISSQTVNMSLLQSISVTLFFSFMYSLVGDVPVSNGPWACWKEPNGGERRRLWCESERLHLELLLSSLMAISP